MRGYAILFALLFLGGNYVPEFSAESFPPQSETLEKLQELFSHSDEVGRHVKSAIQFAKKAVVLTYQFVHQALKDVTAESSLHDIFGKKVLLLIKVIRAKAQLFTAAAEKLSKRYGNNLLAPVE